MLSKDAIPLLELVASSAAIVILPSALVTSIPSPAVKVARAMSPSVPWPINSCPAVGAEPSTEVIEPARSRFKISRVPFVPENTSEVFVASGIKVNLPVESSKPKKPTLAAEPVWYLNSIPRSLLSSECRGGISAKSKI